MRLIDRAIDYVTNRVLDRVAERNTVKFDAAVRDWSGKQIHVVAHSPSEIARAQVRRGRRA